MLDEEIDVLRREGFEPFHRLPGAIRDDETAPGYLMRCLHEIGIDDFRVTLKYLGYRAGSPYAVPARTIAALCGMSVEGLVRATASHWCGGEIEMAPRLSRSLLHTKTRRWCPQCMADDPYCRLAHTIAAFDACPIHGCEIVDRCSCGSRPTWVNSGFTTCGCGRLLCDAPTVEATDDRIAVSRWIQDRIDGKVRKDLLGDLAGEDLGSALSMLARLGWHSAEEGTYAKYTANVGTAEAVRAGILIVEGTDEAYSAMLDRRLARKDARGRRSWGAQKAYGPHVAWLSGLDIEHPLRRRFVPLLLKHAERHEIELGRVARLPEARKRERRYSVDQIAAELGNSAALVRRLLKARGMIPPAPGKGSAIRITAEQMKMLRTEWSRLLTLEELAALLGCDTGTARSFADSELVSNYFVENGLVETGEIVHSRRFDVRDAESILQRLGTAAREAPFESGAVPLTCAAHGRGVPSAEIVRAVLEGRIAIVDFLDDGNGLGSVLVNPETVRSLRVLKERTGLTYPQVRDELGYGLRDLYAYRKQGLLRAKLERGAWVVSTEEVGRLREAYVTSDALVRSFDIPRPGPRLWRYLEDLGIRPVTDGSTKQQLFPRSAIGVLERERDARPVPALPDRALSMKAVRPLFEINSSNFASALIKSGLIRTERRGRERLVQPEEIVRFARTYVTGVSILRCSELTSSVALGNDLAARQVLPVTTLSSHQGILFRVDDVVDAGYPVPRIHQLARAKQ